MGAITDFTWRLFILLFPGIISFIIYRHVSGNKPVRAFKFFMYSAVWGVCDYLILEAIYILFHDNSFFNFGTHLPIWQFFRYKYAEIPIYQTVFAILIGALVAFILGYLYSRFHQSRFCIEHFQQYSHRMDLWDYFLNTETGSAEQNKKVIILDYKNNCTYKGIVTSFSESGKKREIVLKDATVTNKNKFFDEYGKKIVYISLKKNQFCILFPEDIDENEKKESIRDADSSKNDKNQDEKPKKSKTERESSKKTTTNSGMKNSQNKS